jgi:hypothetical protein
MGLSRRFASKRSGLSDGGRWLGLVNRYCWVIRRLGCVSVRRDDCDCDCDGDGDGWQGRSVGDKGP